MRKVEFLNKWRNLLRYDDTDKCYLYRQYGGQWSVRMADESIPYLKVSDSEYVPMDKIDGIFFVPKDRYAEALKSAAKVNGYQDESLSSFAGLLYVHAKVNGKYERLEPPLYIEAGSLTDVEFNQIISRLKQLALVGFGPTVWPLRTQQSVREQREAETQSDDPDTLLISVAEQFIKLCKAVETAWPSIMKNPAQETKFTPQVIDLSQSKRLSSHMAQYQAIRPDARRGEIHAPSYSHDTPENRFLISAFQEIETKYELLCNRLSERAEQLMQRRSNEGKPPIPRTRDAILSPRPANDGNEPIRWERQVGKSEATGKKMSALKEILEPLARKALSYKTASFLSQILDLPAHPDNPSIRLTQSEGYGSVYHAYLKYRKKEKLIVFVQPKKGMIQALKSKSLHSVHRLYELWILIEVYDTLVNRFGFRPVELQGVFHPLQLLDAEGGDLIESLSGTSFQLRFVAQNDPEFVIKATLKYDCEILIPNNREGRYYCPDLYLEIEHGGQIKKFAIDAKYRRYHAPLTEERKQKALRLHRVDVNNIFEDDLFVTGKKKYLQDLRNQAAFIVHSDPSFEFTFWGGTKYPDNNTTGSFPNHQFGAICITPDRLGEIERLLKCFLMYHANINDVCWNCRQKVEPVEEVKEDDKNVERTVGWFYKCPDCSAWWVRTFCQGSYGGHPLLKIGKQTFHAPDASTRRPKYAVVCGYLDEGEKPFK